ncbi:hypothetical protein MKW92_036039 [Papaver armeniacum]|nr:hypothetical protein MKW92_036039 [Papaver armeniacum]
MDDDRNSNSNSRYNEHLGVNKLGKNIRKSPLHQPNFANNNNKPQPPQPHVYNISKNDFRNIVQQLTGSPSQNQTQPLPPPRPTNSLPKQASNRLQKIRPPPLSPINRPPPPQIHNQAPQPHQLQPQGQGPPFNGGGANFGRPGGGQFGQQPVGDANWGGNVVAESPISAYMRYLQNSMLSPRFPQPPPPQHQHQPQPPQPHTQLQPPLPGLLPTPPPVPPPFPSPRGAAPALLPVPPPFPSPRGGSGPALLPSPTSQFLLPSPTSQFLLPSPTSQFVLPSPSAYMSFLSPRSSFPPVSPGFPPLTPTFFSQFSHPGVLGPGPQTPNSPGFFFPTIPFRIFPYE